MFKRIFMLCAFVNVATAGVDVGLTDLDVPAVCNSIEDITSPVDLSPACLAAQIAAQSYPVLLPAANQLCQILEGTTAAIGKVQIQINTVAEQCQNAMLELEEEMMVSMNPQITELYNSYEDHKKLLADILKYEDLLRNGELQILLGVEIEEWEELLERTGNDTQTYADKQLYNSVNQSNYLLDKNLTEGGFARQQQKVKTMLQTAGSHISLKESQDMNVRMTAELVYQQQAFQQLLTQYLALKAGEEQQKLADVQARYDFFNNEE